MKFRFYVVFVIVLLCASNAYAQNTVTPSNTKPTARGVLKLKNGGADASVGLVMWFTDTRGKNIEVWIGERVVPGQKIKMFSLNTHNRRGDFVDYEGSAEPGIKCVLEKSDMALQLQRVDDKYAYYKARVSLACVPPPQLNDTPFRYVGTLNVKLNVVCQEQDSGGIIKGDGEGSTAVIEHKFSTRPKFCVRHFPPNTPGLTTSNRATPKTNP